MKKTIRNKHRKSKVAGKSTLQRSTNCLLPSLLVVGGAAGMIAGPVQALELGQLEVESTLGQPLRASIAYALNTHEELFNFCISLNNTPGGGLQTLTRARVSVTRNRIILKGNTPINEPMLALRLTVNCPYTAHLARDYVVMINPPGTAAAFTPAKTVTAAAIAPVATQAPRRSRMATSTKAGVQTPARNLPPAPAAEITRSPVPMGSEYRVQPGDTLSAIVSRISDRPLGLWAAVDALFQANPDAFIGGDRNRLKAGSLLSVPLMQATDYATNIALAASTSPAKESTAPQGSALAPNSYNSAATIAAPDLVETPLVRTVEAPSNAGAPTIVADDTAVLSSAAAADSAAESPPADRVASARPGDVFVGTNIPNDVSIASTDSPVIAIPDTRIVNQTTTPPVINTIKPLPEAGNTSWSWLMWLGGSGFALILGLLLFGRKIRNRFGDEPTTVSSRELADASDNDDITEEVKTLSDIDFDFAAQASDESYSVGLDSDFSLNDITSLDADLGIGTGLAEGVDMDVAQDFGFSETNDDINPLDLEITPEAAAQEPEQPATDIIPPHLNDIGTILDSEVRADENDDNENSQYDQYDMSMIVDVTKQAIGAAEGTAKDLQAVQLAGDKLEDSGFTMNCKVDISDLERDYEEEFTATQALNTELADAALELASRMDIDATLDLTAEMPSKTNTDAADELTTELPLADDTSINAELTAELPNAADDSNINAELTAELPRSGDAVNDDFISDQDDTGLNAELTAKMPQGDDLTVDMEIESGTVDTKKAAH